MRKLLLVITGIFFSLALFAQETVTGRVTDEKGVGVEGISVREKGGSAGTTTDKNGYYTIRVATNATLVFSGIGFTEKEVSASSKTVDVSMESSSVTLGGVELVGTRSLRRTATETVAPVDIIPISKVVNQMGVVEINSILHYVAPSFNANRQSGSDGTDHIDPATLRGMGPDQTLVLINGKRRHQSALVNIYGTRGRGNTGTDLNAIPASAIDRIEILRDGASAQYGSDAIAGVINIILKSSTNELLLNATAGTNMTGYGSSLEEGSVKVLDNESDGFTWNANANYGIALKNQGYLNLTADILQKNKTNRPNYSPLYPDNYREKFGEGSYTNFAAYFNNLMPLQGKTSFYAFGGINSRNGDAYAWTRDPGSERNVIAIYPDGFNPHIQSTITDLSLSMGVRTMFGVWNADFNATTGSNKFHFEVDKTLNASLEESSPTHFDAGGFILAQNTIGANFSRGYSKIGAGLNLAMGLEVRHEQYRIFSGETGSWKQYVDEFGRPPIFEIDGTDTTFRPGGSQGFPGFQPKDVINASRNNVGAYVDAELDISKNWMVAAAIRVENYSDFGFTTNYKLGTRINVNEYFSLRSTFSTGFRAPSLPQINYSSTFTNVAAGQITDQVIAPNSGPLAQAVGIPELKEETSTNFSAGVVAKPARGLTVTIDGYWISVKDRIVLTGLFDTDDDAIGSILEQMNVGAAQFFTNAVDTKTSGVDVIITHNTRLGKGRLNTILAANFNNMEIENVKTTEELAGKEDIYFGPRERAFLLASAPDHKIGLSMDYTVNKFNALLRLTKFSDVTLTNWNDEPDYYEGKITTDIAFSFAASKNLNITLGGNNIFDVYPTHHDPGLTETGGMWDPVQMGYGGAFFFAKLSFRLKNK